MMVPEVDIRGMVARRSGGSEGRDEADSARGRDAEVRVVPARELLSALPGPTDASVRREYYVHRVGEDAGGRAIRPARPRTGPRPRQGEGPLSGPERHPRGRPGSPPRDPDAAIRPGRGLGLDAAAVLLRLRLERPPGRAGFLQLQLRGPRRVPCR